MKKNRTRSLSGMLIVAGLILSLPPFLQAQAPKKFPKISFLDPHWSLIGTDKANQALTYFGQVESLGVNIIVGFLDSATSDFAPNLQYHSNQEVVLGSIDLVDWTHIGNSVFYEADKVLSSDLDAFGYYFNWTTGENVQDFDATDDLARRGLAGVHSAGYLLSGLAYAVKTAPRSSGGRIHYAKFGLKVSNNTISDTVCDLYFKVGSSTVAERHLKGTDFTVANQYLNFEISGYTGSVPRWTAVSIQVYWRGIDTLYVDQIDWRDSYANTLFGLTPSAVSGAFSSYYSSIDTLKLRRMYPSDEVWGTQLRNQRWFDQFSSVIGPRGKTTSEVPYPEAWNFYLAEVQPLELDIFIYPFLSYHDSSSTATQGAQQAIDNFLLPNLRTARAAAAQRGVLFSNMIQAFGNFDQQGNVVDSSFRDVQIPEIYVQVFMSLTYGAKGIGYFVYPSVYHPPQFSRLMRYIGADSVGKPAGPFPPSDKVALRGLVDWNFDPVNPRFVPNYKWYAVRHADSVLDKIGPVLLDLTWDTAKIANSQIRYLDSLKGVQFSVPYIEAGFFKDSVNADYFMLVNRRVLSTDSQNVTAWLNKAGHSYVIEMFSGDTVLTGNVGTGAPFTTRLNPGEGKLFKVVPAPQYIHGTLNVVAIQGKVTFDGDATVPVSRKVEVRPPKAQIIFLANRDTLHSGVATNKCEFIANGTIEGRGITSDLIKFASSAATPGTQDWFGVRVYGSATFTNCWFKNAYVGIDFQDTAPDTVRGCFFEKNFMFGIQARNSNVYIVQDTFENNTNMGVCFDPASAVIESCYFKSNAIGIYTIGSFGRIANSTIIGTLYGSDAGLQAEGVVGGATQFLTFENNLDSGQFNLAAVIAHARLKVLSSRLKIYAPSGPLPEDPPDNVAILSLGADSVKVRTSTVSYSGYSSTIPLIKVTAAPRLDLGRASPDSGKNSILRGWKSYSVGNYNTTTDSVYAKNNYWGGSANFTGPVAYVPFLTNPPPKLAGDGDGVTPPLPNQFSLNQNYPNPFNPTTTISFALPIAEKVKLDIYNILGQKVRILVDDEKPAGVHTVIWDGTDSRGSPVSSGIYFYKIETSGFREVKRMLFFK